MANNLKTTQYLVNETFVRLVNYLSFAKVANRSIEEDFKNLRLATGNTINYRLEERYRGGEGAVAVPESRNQVIRPLTIEKQFHTMLSYNGFELTFDRVRDQPYLDMALNPRAKTLANKVEKYIAYKAQSQFWQFTGTPGVPISFDTISETDAYMTELGIPEDGLRYFAGSPRMAAGLSNALQNSFNSDVNTGALMDGFIGHLTGFDFFKTNFLRRQIAGAGDGGTVTAPTGFIGAGTITNGPVTGGNTLSVAGVAANTLVFRKGDKLQLDPAADVFMVNPETYEPLIVPGQFVVTADVISTGTTATIPINPTITLAPSASQNYSNAIPNGAQLYLAQSHNESMAFHSSAIVFAAPALKELRGGCEAVTAYSDLYKMAIVYTLGADVRNYEQLDRMDIICGEETNGEMGVIVMS